MYLSSTFTLNEKLEKFALIEMNKIAKMDVNDYMLYLPCNCHGYAGTVSIMSEIYTDTKNQTYKEAARKQLDICINYIVNADFCI